MSTPRTKPAPARAASRSRKGAAPRRRLAPADRRRELVRVAGAILTRDGVDAVQFARVAEAAGVTRPLVYKFFDSRQALIIAVLEDFATELAERFGRGAMRTIPGSNAEVARVFVQAVCDTIEQRGAGPWHLLDAKGPDPLIARRGQEILDAIVAPWQARIAAAAGTTEREAATLARMIVAAGRAVLELWCNGVLTREEAVRDTTRGVSALVDGFRSPAGTPRRRRTARPETRRS
ncbi:MAG: TetR/AcrR family transcriptional regulator [Thermodesulfobacteriota bacterium]